MNLGYYNGQSSDPYYNGQNSDTYYNRQNSDPALHCLINFLQPHPSGLLFDKVTQHLRQNGFEVGKFTSFLSRYPQTFLVDHQNHNVKLSHLPAFKPPPASKPPPAFNPPAFNPPPASNNGSTVPFSHLVQAKVAANAAAILGPNANDPVLVSLVTLLQPYPTGLDLGTVGLHLKNNRYEVGKLMSYLSTFPGIFSINAQKQTVRLLQPDSAPPHNLLRKNLSSQTQNLAGAGTGILKNRVYVNGTSSGNGSTQHSVSVPGSHSTSSGSFSMPSVSVSGSHGTSSGSFSMQSLSVSGSKNGVFIVAKYSEIEAAIQQLSTCSMLAMDCEGVDLSSTGELCLLQLATPNQVFLFDFVSMNEVTSGYAITKLEPILGETSKMLKILHDCRQDSAALWHQHQVLLSHVFDTQAAYMHLALQKSKSSVPAPPSLKKLLSLYAPEYQNHGKDHMNELMTKNPTIWRQRPLTAEMISYAVKDVQGLFKVRQGILDDLAKLSAEVCLKEGERYASLYRTVSKRTGLPCCGVDRAMAFNSANELVPEQDIPENERAAIVKQPLVVGDGVQSVIELLPDNLAAHPVFSSYEMSCSLKEITLDLGRQPIARFQSGKQMVLEDGFKKVGQEDIESSVYKLGAFGNDNRAGVEGTLHRISALRNRLDQVIGLTFRVGRAVQGCADLVRDVVRCESGGSVLLLGPPGTGKTTIIRDIARVLSEDKNVVIIDTSNEIGGDGNIPHPAIGHARRMQVKRPEDQEARMIECVQNHTPDVIIIDEIGRAKEAHAARTIVQRGVRLVASAHGSLAELVQNPVLSELLGGVEIVTVGDTFAMRYSGNKNVQQRKRSSVFQTVIELNKNEMHSWNIFRDIEAAVDNVLQGQPNIVEVRSIDPNTGQIYSREEVRQTF